MKYTLEILPIVYRDLAGIERYIAMDKPDVAKKVVKKITTSIKSLIDEPFLAMELKRKFGLNTDLRGRLVKPYVVIYNVLETHIKVYRVLDMRRDYLRTLGFATAMPSEDGEEN